MNPVPNYLQEPYKEDYKNLGHEQAIRNLYNKIVARHGYVYWKSNQARIFRIVEDLEAQVDKDKAA